MATNWRTDWISYCKACWLADCDISEFYNCEKEQIELLSAVYLTLDKLEKATNFIDTYGQSFVLFCIASDKWDRRQVK